EILHENYSDEICELINKDIDEKSKEYALEQALSNDDGIENKYGVAV
ncbi:MAG: hypothetical protein GY694_08325, partial [Gammaproteobacteria bacterium]|nr:hypothetical protein [Gammaproteobacteria bacterium]